MFALATNLSMARAPLQAGARCVSQSPAPVQCRGTACMSGLPPIATEIRTTLSAPRPPKPAARARATTLATPGKKRCLSGSVKQIGLDIALAGSRQVGVLISPSVRVELRST